MTQKDNGGAAFPNPALADENYRAQPGDNGMSLRDWFAGQALAGMCANHAWMDDFSRSGTLEHTSNASYALADAMIAARGSKL